MTKVDLEYYEPKNIKSLNGKIKLNTCNIWNWLVIVNIYLKGILLLNELILNVSKIFRIIECSMILLIRSIITMS